MTTPNDPPQEGTDDAARHPAQRNAVALARFHQANRERAQRARDAAADRRRRLARASYRRRKGLPAAPAASPKPSEVLDAEDCGADLDDATYQLLGIAWDRA